MTIDISQIGNIESNYGYMLEDYDSELNERIEDAGERDIDLSKVDNIVFDQIDHDDYSDFCDAYILSADMNGIPMSDTELDALNEMRDFVHEKLIDRLY